MRYFLLVMKVGSPGKARMIDSGQLAVLALPARAGVAGRGQADDNQF
jgi:hypothetical protein